MNIERYQKIVSDNEKIFAMLNANKKMYERVVAEHKQKKEELMNQLANINEAINLAQSFSNNTENDIVFKFEGLITKGVREIFGKDYTVKIEYKKHGNTIHADFYVFLPDGKKVNIYTGEGGGLKDFIAVLQRIVYLMLEPSHPSKVLFLDENFSALDSDRSSMAFDFINKLTSKLGIQVIFITHSSAPSKSIEPINIIEVINDGNQSFVKKV